MPISGTTTSYVLQYARRFSWPVHCALLTAIGLGCALLFASCGDSGPTKQVLEARHLLRTDRPQQALDALESDRSAEGRYLRAVALERMQRYDAAREQIALALEQDPENPKYQGFQLRLKLYDAKMASAEEIIRLHQKHLSSAAVSLFAFYANEAKSSRLRAQNKAEEARKHHHAAIEALKTAIALSSEIPEFQREMLAFALQFRLEEPSQAMLAKLDEVTTNDPAFTEQKLGVMLLLGNHDEALDLARQLYEESNRDELSAVRYGVALGKSPPSPENDKAFEQLLERYPRNIPIVSRYAVYLTQSDRFDKATEVLDRAIHRQTNLPDRFKLIEVAIGIPLEARATSVAESQLERYRDEITDESLRNYFEGRLLFLKRDHQAALQKLRAVVEAQQQEAGGSRALAAEALLWMDRIIGDQIAAETLKHAADAANRERNSDSPNDSPGQPAEENGPAEADPPANQK